MRSDAGVSPYCLGSAPWWPCSFLARMQIGGFPGPRLRPPTIGITQPGGPGQCGQATIPPAGGSLGALSSRQSQARGPAERKQQVDEPVGVRVARADDYDSIVAVVDEWWGRPVGSSLPRLFLDHFSSTSRIVEDGLGLAAFLIAFLSPSRPHLAYVHFVGVRPDRRRSGLASQLYESFARYAQERGCVEVRAVTSPKNTGSVRFHTGLGFTVSGPVADYNGSGRPMVTFSRPLSPSNDR